MTFTPPDTKEAIRIQSELAKLHYPHLQYCMAILEVIKNLNGAVGRLPPVRVYGVWFFRNYQPLKFTIIGRRLGLTIDIEYIV